MIKAVNHEAEAKTHPAMNASVYPNSSTIHGVMNPLKNTNVRATDKFMFAANESSPPQNHFAVIIHLTAFIGSKPNPKTNLPRSMISKEDT